MCELHRYSPSQEPYIGYKVVGVDKNGRRYSLAMGFCYDDYDLIPEVTVQERLSKDYNDDILTSGCFKESMCGRTAVFVELDAATKIARHTSVFHGFRVAVFKAEVSDNLMDGRYGLDWVKAGRKLRFLGEVNSI